MTNLIRVIHQRSLMAFMAVNFLSFDPSAPASFRTDGCSAENLIHSHTQSMSVDWIHMHDIVIDTGTTITEKKRLKKMTIIILLN